MMLPCAAPDTGLGIALRVSSYLDCQARALGENGFQALASGPVMAGLLSGLVTIFVALIGYRLLLNQPINLRDGVVLTVRLGFALALVTSWPAFQTLVYRVAVDSPVELANVLLPATGLASEDMGGRMQGAYDTLRLGPSLGAEPSVADAQTPGLPPQAGQAPGPAPSQPSAPGPGSAQFAYPQTASAFVVVTAGMSAALKVAIGFLLAVGPLAVLALLFDATLGLLEGWLRALVGGALGVLATTVVIALHLSVLESELARLQRYAGGGVSDVIDGQALPTIVLLFGVVALAAVWAAARMGGALRLPRPQVAAPAVENRSENWSSRVDMVAGYQAAAAARASEATRDRAAGVADALAVTARREQAAAASATAFTSSGPGGRMSYAAPARGESGGSTLPANAPVRRTVARRTRSAARRDRLA